MKDIVENRRRITLGKKIRLLLLVLQENGIVWCGAFLVYYVSSKISGTAFGWMDAMRRKHGIPGLNSKGLNKAIWEAWDWSAGGDEWTHSQEWKDSVIRCVLEKHIPQGGSVLEIGPGGGRWTGSLISRANRFTGVDISESCVAVCKEKFINSPNASFEVGSGNDLSGISDATLDAIWSFDVFVHINQAEVAAYLDDFKRVMKPGAVAVIHHGSTGGKLGGWRSDLTGEAMEKLLRDRGFVLQTSFKEWHDNGQTQPAGLYEDLITVFRRP